MLCAAVCSVTGAAALSLLPTTAQADPCEARVTNYQAGQVIAGRLMYVADGDSICIGEGRNPRHWVEVRLVDWSAPELSQRGGFEAKAVMDRLRGAPVECTVRLGYNGRTTSYDRVLASCLIAGVSAAEHMRRAGIVQGGRGVR